MRAEDGVFALGDAYLLSVAAVAFSLFFASLASMYVARESQDRGERLQAEADALLDAVLHDPRWSDGRGAFRAAALDRTAFDDLAPLARGRPLLVVVWDVVTDDRWAFGGGPTGGERRTAVTSANVVADAVHPARVAATVWGS